MGLDLNNKELSQINGGAFKLAAGKWFLLGGAVSFAIGIISGFLRPSTCSSGN